MASHLTLEEREVVAHMHRAGKLQVQIADDRMITSMERIPPGWGDQPGPFGVCV